MYVLRSGFLTSLATGVDFYTSPVEIGVVAGDGTEIYNPNGTDFKKIKSSYKATTLVETTSTELHLQQ